jgi:putative sigma-54 modulation protein
MTGMDLLIKGKNMEVGDNAEEYIRGKIGKLERHLPDLEEVKVELTQEMTKAVENRYVVQVTVNTHGTLLRAEERASNVTAAVDTVVDVLSRQIERFKGKLYRSKRRTLSKEQIVAELAPPETEAQAEEGSSIVKVKRFPVKPMSPEEAVEHMELLSHDFFIFFNAENDQFSVLYRRGDGDYGLIEPELA